MCQCGCLSELSFYCEYLYGIYERKKSGARKTSRSWRHQREGLREARAPTIFLLILSSLYCRCAAEGVRLLLESAPRFNILLSVPLCVLLLYSSREDLIRHAAHLWGRERRSDDCHGTSFSLFRTEALVRCKCACLSMRSFNPFHCTFILFLSLSSLFHLSPLHYLSAVPHPFSFLSCTRCVPPHK